MPIDRSLGPLKPIIRLIDTMFCCGTRSLAQLHNEEKAQASREADARHSRMISVLAPPPRAYVVDRPPSWHEDMQAPPAYSAVVPYSSPPAMAYNEKNEKQALAIAYGLEPPQHSPGLSDEGENSDTSSVISTPSTQITGLGSMYTGRTVRRVGDGRMSDEYSTTRPPSYDARSIDRRSSVSSTSTNNVLRHPVMRDGWLENLNNDSRSAYDD